MNPTCLRPTLNPPVVTYLDLPWVVTADEDGYLRLERAEARVGGTTHRTLYNVPREDVAALGGKA